MTPQFSVWIISLVFIGLVAIVFLYAITRGGRPSGKAAPADAGSRGWELFRLGSFSAMVIALVFVTFFTLVRFPTPSQQGSLGASEVIQVVGRQWSWALSKDTVTAGQPIEFDVTSADVNHGFAIYDPSGKLVSQVQAMPEFTNRLLYTFPEPGTYEILCLEYCGVAHAAMRAAIHVTAAEAGASK